jgi:hypothetical protein
MPDLTAERAREILSYDPISGDCQEWVVTPEQSRHNKRLLKAAREAGK